MHDTALEIGKAFFEAYAKSGAIVVEVGSRNVNGSLRDVCRRDVTYIGLDIESGPKVDVVVDPQSSLPLQSDIADIVVSSSAFEHDAFFWQTFLEMTRLAKPGGVVYINAPSNGKYHRHPEDNWRFYPDAGRALVRWATKSGHQMTLIESFVAERRADIWSDFVAIFMKSNVVSERREFLSSNVPCTNIWRIDATQPQNLRELSEDMSIAFKLRAKITRLREIVRKRDTKRKKDVHISG